IFLGSATGLSPTPSWSIGSSQAGAAFGASVATAGDTDGDRLSNVIVGAPLYDDGETDEGAAFLFFGPTVVPCVDNDHDGYCATGPGADCDDTNPSIHPNAPELCNGIDDNCNGSIDEGFGVGSTCTVGLGACTVSGTTACAPDGSAFCNAPPPGTPSPEVCDGIDNDCDGVIDNGLADPNACTIAAATQAGAALGTSVARVGDVHGEGFEDLLVGAPGDGQGRVFLFYGSSSGRFNAPDWSVEGTQITRTLRTVPALFGSSVAGAGDLNRDGFADFIVGAPGYDFDAIQTNIGSRGAVFVYFGSPSGPTLAWSVEGSNAPLATGFGESVAGAGDVNGDGFADVVVGASVTPPNWIGGWQPRATVLLGSSTGHPAASVQILGQSFSGFGRSVASAGDVDGD